jgi:aminopeptidase N
VYSVKPVNYQLSIHDIEFLGNWNYQGRVKIALEINKSAKEIVLNTNQLKIHSAELSTEHTKTETSSKASNISYDAPRQRATLSFDDEFPVTQKAVLDISFQGTVNNV